MGQPCYFLKALNRVAGMWSHTPPSAPSFEEAVTPRTPSRFAEHGAPVDMDVWELPAEHFGSFVDNIPARLGIGKVKLADEAWVSGFVCEAIGVESGTEITALGSWRV